MRQELVYTEEYKGYIIKIIPSDGSDNSPRDDDNFGTMVCFHNRYTLGDDIPKKLGFTVDIDELKEIIQRKDVVALPIYMYDHSGIGISTSNSRYPFNCPWDSGQIGYIYATYEDIRKNWSGKRVTKKMLDRVLEILQSEVNVYNDYLTGNVYGYVVEDKEGNHLDSCWGYIGDYDAKEGPLDCAKDIVNFWISEEEKINKIMVL